MAQSGFFSDATTYYDNVKGICPYPGQFVAGTGETAVGEPVDVATGAMMVSETFCVLPGRVPFAIGYTYRNLDNSNGPMGRGTSLTTDYFLRNPSGNIWELVCPGNRRYLFYPVSGVTNQWKNTTDPEALGAKLSFSAGAGSLRWKDGTTFQFAGTPVNALYDPPKNSLFRIVDRHYNGITIQRQGKGFYATRVTDDRSGAYVSLTYSAIQVGPGYSENRLTSIGMIYSTNDQARYWTISGYPSWTYPFTPPATTAQFTTVTDPRGGTRTFNWTANGATLLLYKLLDPRTKPVVTNTYDSNNRVLWQDVGAIGGSDANMRYRIEYAYSSDHTTLTYRYTNPNTNLEETRTETYYFTKNHYSGYYITKHSDTLGDDTTYTVNPQGPFLVTGMTYHGRTTNLVYDTLGNVTDVTTPRLSATNPAQTSGTMSFHADYDASYNIPTSITFPGKRNVSDRQISRSVAVTVNGAGDVIGVTDPRGKSVTYTYTGDGRGDLLSAAMTITDSAGAVRSDAIQYEYPAVGLPGYDTGKPSAIVDPSGAKTKFTYDNRHRLSKVSDRNSTTALPHTVEYQYNDMDQVTQVIGKMRTDPYRPQNDRTNPWITATTSFEYTNTGQILRITDPNGNFWGYGYDERDRLSGIAVNDSFRNLTSVTPGATKYFKWTPDDQLLEYREVGPAPAGVAGRKVANKYFANGQLQKTTFSMGGSSSTPTLTYAYDPITHLPTSITDSLYATHNFTYDALERLRSHSFGFQSFTYTLDDAGRRTRNAFQNGDWVGYDFDDNDNLVGTYNSAGAAYAAWNYDELGRMTYQRYPDGAATAFRFDSRGFLAEETTARPNNYIYKRGYTYDNVGNVTGESVNGGLVHSYIYDDFDRLVKAQMTGDAGAIDLYCTYDLGGNRTQQYANGNGNLALSCVSTYGDANRLVSIQRAANGGQYETVTYDVSGNITAIGNTTYQWNPRGELVGVNTNATTYTYDPFGRRDTKQTGTDLATFLWDGWNLIVDRKYNAATNPPTQTEDNYMWQSPLLPDTILLRGNTIQLQNRRGDTAALLSQAANAPYATFEYAPYGETIKDTPSVTLNQFPYRFAGRENDGNGLYYFRNRYYSPVLGRFMSEDPIGFLGGTNLYAYANNNPVTYSDPFGLFPGEDFGFSIGDPNNPYLVFTLGGVSTGLATGQAAVASVASFGLYDGGSFKCQPGFGTSVVLATIGREAAITAATLGASGANVCLWKGCFTGDTLVLMADGSAKPIAEIQYGDLVLTKSDATGLVEAKAVTQVFSHEEPSTLRLTFGDGSAIRTTPEHPFWVGGKGWVRAGQLAPGNAIVTRAGPTTKEKSASITSVKTVRGRTTVYNFSVEDSHTYFVQDATGRGEFKWVHNDCLYEVVEAGEVVYVGIAKDYARRVAQHGARFGTGAFRQVLGNLTRAEARAVEQRLIENFDFVRNGGTLLNKINSISSKSPIYSGAVQLGTQLLRGIGYPGI